MFIFLGLLILACISVSLVSYQTRRLKKKYLLLEKVGSISVKKEKSQNSLKIFAVDDNPLCLMLIKSIFEQQGHQVVGTSDKLKAIDLAISMKPDLILCDLMQPNLVDGICVAHVLKSSPQLSEVPIVALTAWDTEILKSNQEFCRFSFIFSGVIPKAETEQDCKNLISEAVSYAHPKE